MATTSSGGEPKRPAAPISTPDMSRGSKRFFSEVLREMRKVNWPSRSETTRLTGVVLAVCGVLVLVLSFLSFTFDIVVRLLTTGRV